MTDVVSSNKTRTALQLLFFMAAATALLALPLLFFTSLAVSLAVGVIGGSLATIIVFRFSVEMVLAANEAEPAAASVYAQYHNLVEGLCVAMGVDKPHLYIVHSTAMNIFSTGRGHKHAALCATTGLLRKLDRMELEAVIAHEMAHIRALDTLSNTVAATTAGIVPLMADLTDRAVQRGKWWVWPFAAVFALLMLGSRLFAPLLRIAIPKGRECVADLNGVGVTRYPPGLAAALEKLRESSTVVDVGSNATAHLWISTPLVADQSSSQKAPLFDTHPPLEERIALLREL